MREAPAGETPIQSTRRILRSRSQRRYEELIMNGRRELSMAALHEAAEAVEGKASIYYHGSRIEGDAARR